MKSMTGRSDRLVGLFLCLTVIIFPPSAEDAYPNAIIVSQISESDYVSYVEDLESFGTRYYNTSGNASAAEYIYDVFASFGLEVAYDPFTYNGYVLNNVVATLPGTRFSDEDRYFIVGAHFDSISDDPQSQAPGADDNASGISAVLEIASVLSLYEPDTTIKFIAFNAEEEDLIGSKAYADEAMLNDEEILAMLNFDMIAYTGGNPDTGPNPYEDLELYGDEWLVDMMIDMTESYTSLSTDGHHLNEYGSDHYYFHSSLYPGSFSVLAIEDDVQDIWEGSNPYYHSTEDTSEHLDFGFAVNITKIGAAAIAELTRAGPTPHTIDNNGKLDLADVILSLQIVSGKNPGDYFYIFDINEDGKIGIEEAIYILQIVAGSRSE